MNDKSVMITDEDKERGYRIGKWHEHNNYECLYCQFSSIFPEKIQKHLDTDDQHGHPWAFPGSAPPKTEEQSSEPTY